MQTSEVRSTVDEQGIRRAEFDMSYRNDQPDIAIIHAIVTNTTARAEAGNEKYAGVSVAESEQDRPPAGRPPFRPSCSRAPACVASGAVSRRANRQTIVKARHWGVEKRIQVVIDVVVRSPGPADRPKRYRKPLLASGAKAGELQSTTDEQGIRHSEMWFRTGPTSRNWGASARPLMRWQKPVTINRAQPRPG